MGLELPRVREEPAPLHVTRRLFMAMDGAGLFEPEDRYELIEGEIFKMAPMEEPHARPIQQLNLMLARSLPRGFTMRCQLPLAAAVDSQPQPDFAIFREKDQPAEDMPHGAALIIEVSDSSLRFELVRKARVYARARVKEYWVLDVRAQQIVVHRRQADQYRTVKTITDLSEVRSSAVRGLVLDLRAVFAGSRR